MKKLILSAFALMVIVSASNAQRFSLGVKFGGIGTKIDGQSFDNGYKLSYQGGAFAELGITNKLGIQPELLFSQTSYRTASGADAIIGNLTPNQDFKLSYLSIPVLLKYNIAPLVSLNLGPQYSILLNKNVSLVDNAKTAFKSGDFSMVGGLQLHLSSLRVYARYVVGLSDLNDFKSTVNTDSWKSQQIEVGIGLKVL